MIRIIIADDHEIVREGLKKILARTEDMAVVDEAADGEELLYKLGTASYDVVILDIAMPGRDGLEILKEIKKTMPKLPVLILSMHPEEHFALRVLKEGACGYLTKESVTNVLIDAIRSVSMGKKYISQNLAERLASSINKNASMLGHEKLSEREFQVMSLLAKGRPIKDIAGELSLSAKTISTYRTRILSKIGISSNAELAAYAVKNNLI